ncbi:MAG: phosphoglucomutase/phosphomannomutase family protein [Clostridia bacterium]|nr:phosphoglucomutase/phosphomannomutase family protein [Clostridia bacterium]
MITFGTGGWRAIIGEDFTKANIQRVAHALARRMIREKVDAEGFVIGYDRRFLSRESAIWFSEVMAGDGIPLCFVNLSAPTPQIMFTVKNMNLPYGAAITASHNPAIYNGVKLFTRGGRDAVQEVTDEITEAANAVDLSDIHPIPFDDALRDGQIRLIDPRDAYLDSIMERIDIAAIRHRRPRIVLDPMFGVSLNGLMTIFYTARCDIDVINDRHDAFFGRHLPAPNPETLVDLQHAVAEHRADIGIATDGDADRLGIIDENGAYIPANEVLVLLYYYLLRYKGWKGDAVRNIATTHLLDRVAQAFGQRCWEVPVGFKHISSGMDEHDALIGGESSGGLTVRGHISGKDGLYAASLLVEMVSVTGKPLSALVAEIYATFGEMHMAEYDWGLTETTRGDLHDRLFLQHQLPDFGKAVERVSYLDGCKVYFADGSWLIARFSGTEPRIRCFAEDATMEKARELVRIMAGFMNLPFDD